MKILTFVFIALFISACGDGSAPTKKPPVQSVFVLFENGGTIAASDQDDALNTMLYLLQQLSEMDRRKATRNAQINIVLGALPNRIAWSGTPRQLMEQAIPDDLALSSFVDDLSVLKVYRVHEDQDQILLTYFAALGVLKASREGALDFSLLGAAQTQSSLSDLL